MKKITIGIPAFKAENHIQDCIASISIQSIKNDINIIIASDNPEDNYSFLLDKFSDLDITILPCDKNTGPGLARQRCLENCKTPWITFIDADDIFYTPFALETLCNGITDNNVIMTQGTFLQETDNPQIRLIPQKNIHHPWVFGRLYNVNFLKDKEINFTELRAMEDGNFNWKIRMTIENSPYTINITEDPVYLWRLGSEHSITRIGSNEKDGIPQYNFDLCQWGATIAAIDAIKFCKKKNPFNGNITQFTVEQMIHQYFTYIECVEKKPIFAEQNLFNAKRFYHECYNKIENDIDDKILKEMYTIIRMQKGEDLINVIPCLTFKEFMNKIKKEKYNGEEEFKQIRNKLPKYIIDNDIKTGVGLY